MSIFIQFHQFMTANALAFKMAVWVGLASLSALWLLASLAATFEDGSDEAPAAILGAVFSSGTLLLATYKIGELLVLMGVR
jgi:hypothetical protein